MVHDNKNFEALTEPVCDSNPYLSTIREHSYRHHQYLLSAFVGVLDINEILEKVMMDINEEQTVSIHWRE